MALARSSYKYQDPINHQAASGTRRETRSLRLGGSLADSVSLLFELEFYFTVRHLPVNKFESWLSVTSVPWPRSRRPTPASKRDLRLSKLTE